MLLLILGSWKRKPNGYGRGVIDKSPTNVFGKKGNA
jgi:hypothetical protein